METSNSTLQRFLGPARKPWMTGGVTGVSSSGSALQAPYPEPPPSETHPVAPRGRPRGRPRVRPPGRLADRGLVHINRTVQQRPEVNSSVQDVLPIIEPSTRINSACRATISPTASTTMSVQSQSSGQRNNTDITTDSVVADKGVTTNAIDVVADADCSRLEEAITISSPDPSEETTNDNQVTTGEKNVSGAPPHSTTSARLTSPAEAQSIHGSLRTVVAISTTTNGPAHHEADTAAVSTSAPATSNPEHDRLRELAARYGGVDELERHLGLGRLARTSSDSNPQSPITTQASTDATITPNVNAQVSQNILRSAPLPGDQAFQPSIRSLGEGNDVNPASSGPNLAQSEQHATTSPVFPTTFIQAEAPLNPPVSPHHAIFEGLQKRLADSWEFLAQSRTTHARSKGPEEFRLRLLMEACRNHDQVFLELHQLYCLLSHPVFSSRYSFQKAKAGCDVLSGLLLPNNLLEYASINWFAKFPQVAPQSAQDFERMFTGTGNRLGALAQKWHDFRARHVTKNIPPHVKDIQDILKVDSPLLQRLIFRSILRGFWPGEEDTCFESCAQVFRDSQKQYTNWLRTSNGDEMPAQNVQNWQNTLLSKYSVCVAGHRHHNVCRGSPTTNSPINPSHYSGGQQSSPTSGLPPSLPQALPPANLDYYLVPSPTSPGQPQFPATTATAPGPTQNSYTQYYSSTTVNGPNQPRRQDSNTALPRPSHFVPPSWTTNRSIHSPVAGSFFQNSIGSRPSPQSTHVAGHIPQATSSLNSSPGVTGSSQVQQPTVRRQSGPGSGSGSWPTSSEAEVVSHTRGIINSLSSSHALPVLPNRTQNTNPLLFPYIPLRKQNVQQQNQLGIPAHQAHLRDAVSFSVFGKASGPGSERMFSYFSKFDFQPVVIKPTTLNARNKFMINAEMYSKLPRLKSDTALGGPPTRCLHLDSILLRVRCVRNGAGATSEVMSAAAWAAADTEWPQSLTLFINDRYQQVRRKTDWGKDLAIDISSIVKEGENTMRVSLLQGSQVQDRKVCYALAIEILSIGNVDSVKKQVQELESSETRQRIRRQLNSADDEIEIISNELVIKITDPFSSQLLQNPVRGKDCVHYECFDLDIFLQTRKTSDLLPEQFRCPICGCDARPSNLQTDNWFVEILAKIKETGEDARAIIVNKEAEWRVKEEEKEGESGDGTGVKNVAQDHTPGLAGSAPDIIELD